MSTLFAASATTAGRPGDGQGSSLSWAAYQSGSTQTSATHSTAMAGASGAGASPRGAGPGVGGRRLSGGRAGAACVPVVKS